MNIGYHSNFMDIKIKEAEEYIKKAEVVPKEPITNEEWFCGLSTEEKAEFIATQCFWSYSAGFRGKLETKYASGEYWDKWLKEKHE